MGQKAEDDFPTTWYKEDQKCNHAHTGRIQIHTETDAALTDGVDDDMALGRSCTQMVDT